MFFAAVDLVCFGGAEFEEVFVAFGFSDHVNGVIVVFDDGPIGDVLTDGGVDLEFVGELDEEFDVIALIEFFGKFIFN